jgi:hypothetical protein
MEETEKLALVQRIAESPPFGRCHALKAFLLFVTQHAIAGKLEYIKEQRIGCEVLGRRQDYDPAVDNIVRVRAQELRQRLAQYFATIGADEPVVITIPKGSYVPIFQPRAVAPVTQHPQAEPVSGAYVPRCAAWTETQWTAVRDLWGQFFPQDGHELMVVASDAAFAMWQDVTGNTLSLGDYLGRKYFEMGDPHLREIAARPCIALADLSVALDLVDVSEAFGGHVRSRYARDLSMRDLRTGNAVMMGSKRSNPWLQLFEPFLNFVLTLDPPPGGPRFHNTMPRSGEAASFAIPCRFDIEGAERVQMESYAMIALLPNLSDAGHVLILEGLSMEGTQAAGESVTNPERLCVILRHIGHKPGTTVRPFEALLKLTSIPGGYAHPKVVAFRYPAGRAISAN